MIVIYSRDDDNSGTITHAASDSVAGTTGWNQAGCAIGNLRIAHCIFWKIATTGTALGFTVSYTPTGVVQNAELSVYAFPNAPDPSPVDCFTAATFSSNAGTQTSGNYTATYTTDAIVSTVSCAGSTDEFSVGTGCSSLFVSPSNTSWKGEGKAVSAAGTYNATWASASGCTSLASIPGVIAIVAWKAADGAPNGTARHKLLFSSNQLRRAPGMGVLAPGGRSDSDSQPGRTLGAFNPDDRRGRVLPWGGGHARVTAT